GSVAVRLRLGDMDGWCANAPALAQGKPPSTAQTDRPDLFKSERNAPAPAACPAVPAGSSASGALPDQGSVRRGGAAICSASLPRERRRRASTSAGSGGGPAAPSQSELALKFWPSFLLSPGREKVASQH